MPQKFIVATLFLQDRPVCEHGSTAGSAERPTPAPAVGMLKEAWLADGTNEPTWRLLASGRVLLQSESTVVDAELHGLEQAVAAVVAIIRDGHITFDNNRVSSARL